MQYFKLCRPGLLTLLVVAGSAFASDRPDFSSVWYFQAERSEPSDGGGRSASLKLRVVQEKAEIAIDRTYNSFAVYENLTFDGSESESE